MTRTHSYIQSVRHSGNRSCLSSRLQTFIAGLLSSFALLVTHSHEQRWAAKQSKAETNVPYAFCFPIVGRAVRVLLAQPLPKKYWHSFTFIWRVTRWLCSHCRKSEITWNDQSKAGVLQVMHQSIYKHHCLYLWDVCTWCVSVYIIAWNLD